MDPVLAHAQAYMDCALQVRPLFASSRTLTERSRLTRCSCDASTTFEQQ